MAGEESDDNEPDVPDDDESESGTSAASPDPDQATDDDPSNSDDGKAVDDDTTSSEPADATSGADPDTAESDPEEPGPERSAGEETPAELSPQVGDPDTVDDAESEDDTSGSTKEDPAVDAGDESESRSDEDDPVDDETGTDDGSLDDATTETEEPEEETTWETWFAGEDGIEDPDDDEIEETGADDATATDMDSEASDPEGPGFSDDTEELGGGGVFGSRNAPDEDQEMPLTEHVEEMLKRLAVVVAVAGIVSLLTFPFADRLINIIWYGILPGTDVARPRVYGILSLLFTRIKVASLAGVIVALPVLVYQTYQFMRPGLYPHERRYYLAAIPTSLVLAIVGVSFAYFIVLPTIFTYFLYYSESVATIGFALMKTFDLILLLMGYLAVVFQIPLFIMLAMMMGLVTRQWLADRRLIFWGAFLGISFLFSPDPTGMAPVIVALTMVGLFEGTLLVTRWAGR